MDLQIRNCAILCQLWIWIPRTVKINLREERRNGWLPITNCEKELLNSIWGKKEGMIDYQSQIWAKELSKSIWGKKEGMINYQLQIGTVRGNDRIDGLWKHNHLRLEKVSSMHSLTPGHRLWLPIILVPIPEMRMHMAMKAVMEQQWLLSNDTLHATMFLQPKSCWKWEFAYGNGSSNQRSSNCCCQKIPCMHATHVPATKIPPNSHSQMFSKQKTLKQNLIAITLCTEKKNWIQGLHNWVSFEVFEDGALHYVWQQAQQFWWWPMKGRKRTKNERKKDIDQEIEL